MRVLFACAVLAFAGCLPSDHCASIALGTRAEALPLRSYSLESQGGIFDKHFPQSLWTGPHEFRCCVGARAGVRLSECPAEPDCSSVGDVQAMQVGEPFTGALSDGTYFCRVAVKDGAVVSVWGQYQD